jgi:tetratricopeptide (TPR) repeat protein
MPRPVCIHHCTSEPYRFLGRAAELALLDDALAGGSASVVALVGPGGQGKTAIVQHWLGRVAAGPARPDGVFLWSFYRGKDADLCLRSLYAYAEGLLAAPDLSASYCVDHLLPVLRRERWAVVLDGAEVAQYEDGPWRGRFLHPELGRLLEELASERLPGVVVLTTRFELPTLARRHARILGLDCLDPESARNLLADLGVRGTAAELDEAALAAGRHAKAVELLGTFLAKFCRADARSHRDLPKLPREPRAAAVEYKVSRVLAAFQTALPAEAQDILALATAFRDPPAEGSLLEYLASAPVRSLLHEHWGRTYTAFVDRPKGWLASQVQDLVALRLLERVGAPARVIDAHPLVRRAFEGARGPEGARQSAGARAGFLRGRPDRQRPQTLAEAREEVELFHAFCEAGLWKEADSTFVALDNPKHRFLAPALERDLLLRFFPGGDWRRTPLWAGFGRYRSLAIALEMLGQFEDALEAYRQADAPLRGDALLALGRLGPLLEQPQAPHPWQTLWGAYHCHALALAGRSDEALAVARGLIPVDVYEWVHVFECLLRLGRLDVMDLRSLLFRPPGGEHRWADLARRRMRADYLRVRQPEEDLQSEYRDLLEEYDRAGLPLERALTRLSYGRCLLANGDAAADVADDALHLARRHGLHVLEADALDLVGAVAGRRGDTARAASATAEASQPRGNFGYLGSPRP